MQPNDILKKVAKQLDDKLEKARYKTIVHGDAKVANFCFGKLSRVHSLDQGEQEKDANNIAIAGLDFQYCGNGVGVRDVAYFLGSVYTDDELAICADECFDYYFAVLSAPACVEEEWRSLISVCFADFERFMRGWNPGGWKFHGRGHFVSRMIDTALMLL